MAASMLVGTSYLNATQYAAANTSAGPLRVARVFKTGNFGTNWSADVPSALDDHAIVISWKPDADELTAIGNGDRDTAITTYMGTAPTDVPVFAEIWHELDVKDRQGTLPADQATILAAKTRFYTLVKAVQAADHPRLYTAWILSAFDANDGYDEDQWWVGEDGDQRIIDIIGADVYQASNTVNPGAVEQGAVIALANSHGCGYGMGELGLHDGVTDTTAAGEWLTVQGAFAADCGIEINQGFAAFICYFDFQATHSIPVPSGDPAYATAVAGITATYDTDPATWTLQPADDTGGGDVTTYFEEDFSGGSAGDAVSTSNTDFDLVSGTAPVLIADALESGAKSMHINITTAGISSCRGQLGAVHSPVFLNYQIKAISAWSANAWFPEVLRSGSTNRADMRIPGGKFTLRNNQSAVFTSSTALDPDVWYTFEHKIDNTAGKQSLTIWDASGTQVQASGDQTYNAGTVDNFTLGNVTSIASVNVEIGHVRVADTSLGPITASTNWPGSVAPSVTATATIGAHDTRAAAAAPTVGAGLTAATSSHGHNTAAGPAVRATLSPAGTHTRQAAVAFGVTAAATPAASDTRAAATTANATASLTPSSGGGRAGAVAPTVTATSTAAAHDTRAAAAAATVAASATAAAHPVRPAAAAATVDASFTIAAAAARAAAVAAAARAQLTAQPHHVTDSTRDLGIDVGNIYTSWRADPPTIGWTVGEPETGWTTAEVRT